VENRPESFSFPFPRQKAMAPSLFDHVMEIFHYFRLGNETTTENYQQCYYLDHSLPSKNSSSLRRVRSQELPLQQPDTIRLVIVSDTHQRHRTISPLPSGDIFIHAGDILMTNRLLTTQRSLEKLHEFNDWLSTIPCPIKVVICGNHDQIIEDLGSISRVQEILTNANYLQNTFLEISFLKIWGTPLSAGHSSNDAFQSNSFLQETQKRVDEMVERQERVDILITHGPNPHLAKRLQPRLVHVWGHAHGAHGVHQRQEELPYLSVNASIMNTRYNPHQHPIVIDLPAPKKESREEEKASHIS
jgi:predicted phosphohydrolase